jgi:HK97 family phage portal protein
VAFSDFFKGSKLFAAATGTESLTAAWPEDLDLLSPWADNSGLATLTLANLYDFHADFSVNRKSAMSIAAIAKCRNLLATSVARLSMDAVRNGQVLKSQPSLLAQIENGRPNFITLTWIVDSLYFHGRAFLVITDRDAQNRVKSLRYVPEGDVETDENGQLVKAFGKAVSPANVFRIDGHNEGILNFAQETIREAKAIDRAASNASENPVPSILLKQIKGDPLTNEEIDGVAAQWSANRQKRGGAVSFINDSLDVETLGQHHEQLLIDARNVSALNIARISGLPAWAVDASVAGSSLSYSNVESRNRELLDYGLLPYLTTIEEHFSMLLPAGQKARFNTDELLRADASQRFGYYATAITAGIYTVNEVRELENLEPLPEAPEAPQTSVTEEDE